MINHIWWKYMRYHYYPYPYTKYFFSFVRSPFGGLTHYWDRETHICIGEHAKIGSDNGLSPKRRQAVIWTNAGILLIEPLGTNFKEILSEIHTFSFKKMNFKMSSGKWRPFCLGLSVLMFIPMFLFISQLWFKQCLAARKQIIFVPCQWSLRGT